MEESFGVIHFQFRRKCINLVKSSTSGGTSGLKKLVLQCSIMKFNYLALFDLSYRDIIMPYAVVTAVFRVDGQGHVLRSFPGHS